MDARKLPDSLPGIDVKSAIDRIGGGVESYLHVLAKFAKNHAGSTAEIKSALAKNDAITAQRLAHALAGVSGNIGAGDVSRAALRLETALREDDRKAWQKRLDETDTRLAAALASIASLNTGAALTGADRAGKARTDFRRAAALASELLAAVGECDAGAKDLFAALKRAISDERYREDVAAAEECLEKYDFNGAGAAVRKLAKALAAAE
ncbi:MAG: Hpt domain-containing protein [Spirochaetales bacterium]|nr:Hpt domain-containing protein [Spirochaetales bacterium]